MSLTARVFMQATWALAVALWLSLCGCRMCCAGEDPRPILDIWTCGTPADQRLTTAWNADPEFRAAIKAKYRVQWWSIPAHPLFATSHGILAGPTFILNGRKIGVGFGDPDTLLQGLQVSPGKVSPPPASTPPPAAPPPELPNAPPFQSPAAPDLDGFKQNLLAELSRQIAASEDKARLERDSDRAATHNELVRQLHELEARLKSHTPEVGLQLVRIEERYREIVQQLHALSQRPLPQQVPDRPARPEASPPAGRSAPSFWSRTVSVFGFALSVAQWAGIAGVSGGSFGLAGLAVWLLGGWRRSRATPANGQTPPSAQCQACLRKEQELLRLREELAAVQAKAARPDSPLYAPYEVDRFEEAYEWARELVRKYPGSVDSLELLKKFIDQFLSSKPKGKSC